MTLFIRDRLQRICAQTGITMIIVSHDLEEAVYLADQVMLLSKPHIHLGELWPTKESTTIDADEVVRALMPLMESGDVLAHPFTYHPGGFVSQETGEVHPGVWEALERGDTLLKPAFCLRDGIYYEADSPLIPSMEAVSQCLG